MAGHLESRATLPWLVRLRWIALGGQLVALVLYHRELGTLVPSLFTVLLVAFGIVSNLTLWVLLRRVPDPPHADRIMGGVLTLDTVFLTGLLAGSGGPQNPFTIFYLVHIVLAALVLQARTTVWITALSAFCFAALFVLPGGDAHPVARDHAQHMAQLDGHLRGMWIAFAIAASVIAYFVRKISLTIAEQREQIAQLRESAATNARFASLATLAAGAAHELGTPLGTIAVAAHELELSLARRSESDLVDDAHLIGLEVERCRVILGGMAGQTLAEDQKPRELPAAEIVAQLRERFDADRAHRIDVRVDDDIVMSCRPAGLVGALAALVKNAFDCIDRESGRVRLEVRAERDDSIAFTVRDEGPGMAADVCARAGEPFFTTKEPGHGMGLGLFLARAFAEGLGGRLVLASVPGRGTDATLLVPRRSS